MSKKKRKTHEEFVQEVYELVGKEYEVIGEFRGVSHRVNIMHVVCGVESEFFAYGFLNGTRCKKCNLNIRHKKTHEEFLEQIFNLVGDEYLVLGCYKGTNFKTLFKHVNCGYEWKLSPNSFVWGCARCPVCNGAARTQESFIKEIYEIVGSEYEVLSNYVSAITKIKIKHNNCGNVYHVSPNAFLAGNRCPKCNASKGEKLIANKLNYEKIIYKSEKRFDGCRNLKALRFDFFISDSILIEWDGEQHFRGVDFAGKGKEWANNQLIINQRNDKIKNQYCIDSNIPLIRIPYWEFSNIESILENTLVHFGLVESNYNYDNSKVLEYLVDENWDHDEYIAKCPKNIKEQEKSDSIAI